MSNPGAPTEGFPPQGHDQDRQNVRLLRVLLAIIFVGAAAMVFVAYRL